MEVNPLRLDNIGNRSRLPFVYTLPMAFWAFHGALFVPLVLFAEIQDM